MQSKGLSSLLQHHSSTFVSKVTSLFFNGGPPLSLLQGSQRKLSPSHTHTDVNSDIKLHPSPEWGPAACGEGRRGQQHWGLGPIHHCLPASGGTLLETAWRRAEKTTNTPTFPPGQRQELGLRDGRGEPVKSYGPKVCIPPPLCRGAGPAPRPVSRPQSGPQPPGGLLLLKALHDKCTSF